MSVNYDKEATAAYGDHKDGSRDEFAQVTISAPAYLEDHDDRDPELIPTPEDLKTLRRVPAGMP
jgi:hypothetical protein